MDEYHRCTLRPSQAGAFAYVFPLAQVYDGVFICIDMVLPMVWVELPKLFLSFSEILTDTVNALVNMDLTVPAYVAIAKIPSTPPRTR